MGPLHGPRFMDRVEIVDLGSTNETIALKKRLKFYTAARASTEIFSRFFKYNSFIRTSQIDDLHSVHKSRWCCLVKRPRSTRPHERAPRSSSFKKTKPT